MIIEKIRNLWSDIEDIEVQDLISNLSEYFEDYLKVKYIEKISSMWDEWESMSEDEFVIWFDKYKMEQMEFILNIQ